MLKPGTTEAENEPVYLAGLLVAQAWGMLDDMLKGKTPEKEISPNLKAARDALQIVLNLLREAD